MEEHQRHTTVAQLRDPSSAVADSADRPRAPSATGQGSGILMLVATLFESRWFIVAGTAVALALSVAYVALATPMWQSETVVQIEDRSKTLAGLEELSSVFAEKNVADAEIELIRSRSLLGKIVDQLNLTVEARPRTFPIVGAALARDYKGETVAPPRLGLESFAWGGERIKVTRLEVPHAYLGKWLDLVASGDQGFDLRNPDGETLASGRVGEPVSTRAGVNVFVQELVARRATRFRVRQRAREAVIDELRDELRVAERVKKTGFIAISLSGPNRELVAAILDATAQGYVRQNVQRRSAGAAKTLEFIEEQLPEIRERVDQAQAALNRFQQRKGTVDLSAETDLMVRRSVELEKALSDLELQRRELAGRFAEAHPALATISRKEDRIRSDQAALAQRMRKVPERELESARLTRDLGVTSELYFTLLNKAQELRVVKSGTVGNVHIVDAAVRPEEPVSPRPMLSYSIALVLGMAGSVGVAFARRSLQRGVEDPDVIESLSGVSVYAAIPHSDRQVELTRKAHGRGRGVVLARAHPEDAAVEALRSLRTNLQFALTESRNNVIAITGPAPEVGKSFLCVNFAEVLAAAGQRVLLVDADLRRGRLHRDFAGKRDPGLSDVLAGETKLSEAIRRTGEEKLCYLACGSRRPNPSEMLGSARLNQVLHEAAQEYDLVVVDTAPVLAVTDGALVGRWSGVNLVVLRAGAHSAREITLTLKRLQHGGVAVSGIVINDASIGRSRFGRYAQYGFYAYEYRAAT